MPSIRLRKTIHCRTVVPNSATSIYARGEQYVLYYICSFWTINRDATARLSQWSLALSGTSLVGHGYLSQNRHVECGDILKDHFF